MENNENFSINNQETDLNSLLAAVLQLQNENKELKNRCAATEHQFKLLIDRTVPLQQAESDLQDKTAEIHKLQTTEHDLLRLLDVLRTELEFCGTQTSFRLGKVVELLQSPQKVNLNSRLAVLRKLCSKILLGKEFCKDYTILNEVISHLDSRIADIAKSSDSSEKQLPAPEDEWALVSIVLPIYNQADLAAESIKSVLSQTYSNWELIIIDDGSTDNLDSVVAPFLTDKRIYYLKQPNQRLPKALSNGFRFARGDFMTWTSADNRMHPQMLARLVSFLIQNPGSAMVYADYMTIDEQGNSFGDSLFRPHNKKFPGSPELYLPHSTRLLNLVKDNFIGACFMYRRSTKQLIGDYDPQLGVEDYDYWMRINSMMRISHLGTHELLYSYMIHNNSLSARAAELKIDEKGLKLMEYEKQRCIFYYSPFEIYGKYNRGDLYFGDFIFNFHSEPYAGDDKPDIFAKRILITTGKDLGQYTPEELKKYNFIAAYFYPGEANDAGKNAWKIRRFKIQCFARPNTPESQRLHVMTDHCIECQPEEFGFLTLIAANNRMFFEATRSPEERFLKLPHAPVANSGKIIILLDKIGVGGLEQVAYDMFFSFEKYGRDTLFVSRQELDPNIKLPAGLKLHVLDQKNQESDFKKLLEAEKNTVVVSHFCTWGAEIAHKMQVPFFQVIHNTYAWFEDPEIQEFTEAIPYTSGYIAVSATVAWYAMECFSLSPEKIIIMENGINFDNFQYNSCARETLRRELGISDKQFMLLNPASIYGAKGQMNLVIAFANAYAQNPNLRLVIAGKVFENQYYEDVKQVIRDVGMQDVISIGRYFENMADVYSAADAVVLSSFWEGCSLTVAETVHMQKPLLASITGDVERQTDYCNSVLFNLPFDYITEITGKNCGSVVYKPNEQIINSLADGMIKISNKEYLPFSADNPVTEQSADEVYKKYLNIFDFYAAGIDIVSFRHNL